MWSETLEKRLEPIKKRPLLFRYTDSIRSNIEPSAGLATADGRTARRIGPSWPSRNNRKEALATYAYSRPIGFLSVA